MQGQAGKQKTSFMKKVILIFATFSIVIINNVFAQTIRYVTPTGTGNGTSWANASGSIQNMIDYSNAGNQVWVAGGTYLLAATIDMKDGVDVYGGFFGDETNINQRLKSDLDGNGTIEPWEFTHATVLNGQNARRVLNQANNFITETVWDGVTITSGRAIEGAGASIRSNTTLVNSIIYNNVASTTNYGTTQGGGIYNRGTIRHCLISGNKVSTNGSNTYGGGVYNYLGTIDFCVILENTASSSSSSNATSAYGGGIYTDRGTITNCTINGNMVSVSLSAASSGFYSNSYGGGIYSDGGTTTNCTITENKTVVSGNGSSLSSGGGIYGGGIINCVVTNNTASAGSGTSTSCQGGGIYGGSVSNCIVKNNKTTKNNLVSGDGGGIYAQTSSAVSLCIIEGNSASNGGGIYGAYAYNGIAVIKNCLLLNNNAVAYGGGGYDGAYTNCTFIGNTAESRGGGIYYNAISNNRQVTNSIFWNNYAPMWEQIGTPVGSNPANISYSAVQDGYAGTGNITLAEDNETGGPLFVNPQEDIFLLQANSPCVNAGNNAALTAADTTDLSGLPRIYDGIVDMGAYERQPMPTFSIAGKITSNDSPLEGVTINYTGGFSMLTNTQGAYSITVEMYTSVTLTPTSSNYIFVPTSITCANVTTNIVDQDFVAHIIIPVTDITDVPNTATASIPLTLSGTVVPENATFQTIVWSVVNAGTTGASITDNLLNTDADGTVTIRATIVNGTAIGADYTKDFTITVIPCTYTVTATAGTGGTILPSGAVSVGCGNNQIFTATPNTCQEVYQWTVNGTVAQTGGNTFTLTNVQANATVNVTFQAITYTVTATAGTGGTISPSGAVSVACGNNQLFTATPNSCQEVHQWSVNGTVMQTGGNTYTLTNVQANATVNVTFQAITYTVTATAGSDGTISPSGAVSVNCGEGITFSATPNNCQQVHQWFLDGVVAQTGGTTFSLALVDHNLTVNVSFTPITYTVTATAGSGGTISPSDAVSVNCGENQPFTITPDEGYLVAQVLVDENPVSIPEEGGVYSFTDVTDNHTINVTFKEDVGIQENAVQTITVFPNPTTGELYITSHSLHITHIEIFDISGKNLLSHTANLAPQIKIDISHLAKGVYILKIYTGNDTIIQRIVKE